MKRSLCAIALLMVLLMQSGCASVPSLEKVFQMDQQTVDKKLFNMRKEDLRNAWGEPSSFFSGLYGDIYANPDDKDKLIGIYYDLDSDKVMRIVFFDRQK